MSIQTLEIDLPENLAPEARKEIETKTLTVAKAIAVSMSVVGLSPDFDERSGKLIAEANTVPQVQTPAELDAATVAWKHIQSFRIEMRKEEDRMKAPLNEVKKSMMEIVDKGMSPIEKAEKRLSDMINGYARERAEEQRKKDAEVAAENARVEAQRQKAIADAAKLAQDQKDAEERARLALEMAKTTSEDPQLKALAEEEAKKQQDIAAALEEQQLAASLDIPAAPAPVIASAPAENPKGLTTKAELDFRIIGTNEFERAKSMISLAAQFPYLFSLTTEKVKGFERPTGLRLQRTTVLDIINGRAPAFNEPPKGIETFETYKSSVR